MAEPSSPTPRWSGTDFACLGFGAWTLTCQAVVWAGGSLTALGIGSLGLALGLALLAGSALWRRPPSLAGRNAALVWGLGALGAAVTLLFIRPDIDDAFYVNLAVSAMDAPGEALLRVDGLHGLGLPLHLPIYRLHSYELLAAVLGHGTGTEAIGWLHRVFPAGAAFLLVACQARLLRALAPERWQIALVVSVALLLWVGGEHRSPGNFGFLRLHQGKALLVTLMLPLLGALALEFARAPGGRRWLLLAAAVIGSVGLSASALWLAPFVVGVALLAGVERTRRGGLVLAAGGLTLIYPLGLALALRGETAARLGALAEGPTGLELVTLAAKLVVGSGLFAGAVALALATAWLFAPPGAARRYLLLAPVAFLGVLWNPLVAPGVAAQVTGESTYWRVFWALPLPAFLALGVTAPLSWRTRAWDPFARWGVSAGLAGLLALSPGPRLLAAANGTGFAPLALERPALPTAAARALAANASAEQTVLAPFDVAPWLVTLPRHPKPLAVRGVYLTPYAEELGEASVGRRLALGHWISTPEQFERRTPNMLAELAAFDVAAVCLNEGTPAGQRVAAALARAGYRRVAQAGDYAIWKPLR